MIRLLILGLLGFLAYTLFTAITRSLPGKGNSNRNVPRPKTRQGEDMVQDPQCGTYVPRGDAVEKTVGGKKYYFCSTRCRDEFVAKKR